MPRTTGTIKVTVQDNNGNKITGASVVGVGSGITDSNGEITFDNVNFGTHSFIASKAGYAIATGNVSISNSDPDKTVTVTLNELTYNFNATVTDNISGIGIGGVSVTLTGLSIAGISVNETVTTNSSGITSFTDIPYGVNYTLSASKISGYNDNSTTISIMSTAEQDLTLDRKSSSISVNVKGGGVTLNSATVLWTGAGTGNTTANASGNATIDTGTAWGKEIMIGYTDRTFRPLNSIKGGYCAENCRRQGNKQ